jgi:hypothetical protein
MRPDVSAGPMFRSLSPAAADPTVGRAVVSAAGDAADALERAGAVVWAPSETAQVVSNENAME